MNDNIRVLFVDDEENVLRALRRLFRREPWESHFVSSGAEALAKFQEEGPFDLVVADHRMPGMTGVELLKTLRVLYPSAVRMVLSSYTDVDVVLDAINEGAVYKFLTKSCSDTVLRDTVADVVEAARLRRENRALSQKLAAQESEIDAVDWLVEELRGLETDTPQPSFRGLIEALPVAVAVTGSDLRVCYVNPEARRVLGHPDVLGQPLSEERLAARGLRAEHATFEEGGRAWTTCVLLPA